MGAAHRQVLTWVVSKYAMRSTQCDGAGAVDLAWRRPRLYDGIVAHGGRGGELEKVELEWNIFTSDSLDLTMLVVNTCRLSPPL